MKILKTILALSGLTSPVIAIGYYSGAKDSNDNNPSSRRRQEQQLRGLQKTIPSDIPGFPDLNYDKLVQLCDICELCGADSSSALCKDITPQLCNLCLDLDDYEGATPAPTLAPTPAGSGPAPDSVEASSCFSEVSQVQHLNGDVLMMTDLAIGDHILTGSGEYEEVYVFGHQHATKDATFFQIHSSKQKNPLEVTGEHLIFLHGESSPVRAASVQIGDVLHTLNGGSAVTNIKTVQRKGIYAPLTVGGTLVVDGVVASSYVTFRSIKEGKSHLVSDHEIIHFALSPYRLLCQGVSSHFCADQSYSNEDGMPYYAHYGLELLAWIFDSSDNIVGSSLRVVAFAIAFSLLGVCRLLEASLGAALAPLILSLAASARRFLPRRRTGECKAEKVS